MYLWLWQGVTGGGTNGSAALFDEQHAAGDPASGKGEIVLKSSYNPGWTKWMYPNAGPYFAPVDGANGGVQALIDLKVRSTWLFTLWGVCNRCFVCAAVCATSHRAELDLLCATECRDNTPSLTSG